MAMEDAIENVEDVEGFTVPLLLPDPTTGRGNGTGVLVELKGHFYIFTAGHCITKWNEIKEGNILKVRLGEVEVSLPVLDAPFVYESLVKDFGLFKLSPECACLVTREGKQFLPEDQLELSLPELTESVFISGFPGLRVGAASLEYMVFRGGVYPTIDTRYPYRFRICIPREELEQIASQDPWTDPNSQGISGGGCWVMRDRGGQRVPCLAATHFSAERDGIIRYEAQLENHLLLLAETEVAALTK